MAMKKVLKFLTSGKSPWTKYDRDYSSVLVLNCGSSSVKCQALDVKTFEVQFRGHAERLNAGNPSMVIQSCGADKEVLVLPEGVTHEKVFTLMHDRFRHGLEHTIT